MANTIGMEAIVEIDENERYWVGKGFGKGGLLPNDRGAYTTTDGSIFWKSLQEASEDLLLLGRGWKYSDDDGFLPTRPQAPEGCWMYATDFGTNHMLQAKPDHSTLHFVRFRRLVRVKKFDPEEFVSRQVYEQCDHCDSVSVEALSQLLLDVLAYTSMLHNKSQATDAVLLPLKKVVIDLAISHEVAEGPDPDAAYWYQLQMLRRKLENFVEKERSHSVLGRLLSSVDFSFPARTERKEFLERRDDVAAGCLPKDERDAIAGLIVRKLDPNFQVHCDQKACGDQCPFARAACPNKGCPEIMSRIHLTAHDIKCGYKEVECECGETFNARELPVHRAEACRFRIVDCPFKGIGCIKEVKACDLQQHVIDDMTSHLLLAVGRIERQEQVIGNLHTMIKNLRSEKEELSRNLQAEKDNSAKELSQLETKLTKLAKDLGDFEKSTTKELKRLNTPKQTLT